MSSVIKFVVAVSCLACSPAEPSLALRAELDALRAEVSDLRVDVQGLRSDLSELPPARHPNPLSGVSSSASGSNLGKVERLRLSAEVREAFLAASEEDLRDLAVVIVHRDDRGQIDGLRLTRVLRDQLLYTMGLRSGDVIHEISGHRLVEGSDFDLLRQKMQAEGSVEILLTRRGDPLHFFIYAK